MVFCANNKSYLKCKQKIDKVTFENLEVEKNFETFDNIWSKNQQSDGLHTNKVSVKGTDNKVSKVML